MWSSETELGIVVKVSVENEAGPEYEFAVNCEGPLPIHLDETSLFGFLE